MKFSVATGLGTGQVAQPGGSLLGLEGRMAETRLAFLAGLGGFNAHGAGFLQAARDNEIKPDLVTATSGQIAFSPPT